MIETQKIIHHCSPVDDESRERIKSLKEFYSNLGGCKVRQQTYDNAISLTVTIEIKKEK